MCIGCIGRHITLLLGWRHYDVKFQNTVVVCSGLTSLSTIFHSYYDGVWLQQGAQCSLHSAASLKYHAPGTWHLLLLPIYSIHWYALSFEDYHQLTWYHQQPHYPVTGSTSPSSTPVSLSAKWEAASRFFNDFGMSWPGSETVTTCSLVRTLYRLELPGPVNFKMSYAIIKYGKEYYIIK